ncbi:MAG TPA: dihydrofolate reductase family protein [Acidimicrobiales bacterium]|nr:dihydrofolate reductase family protein [Acidimicrobiales bacterium]
MGRLVYAAIASLDRFIEDAQGSFEWAAPDTEVHRFVNELERSVGTYLYGRRMYETMRFWESVDPDSDDPLSGDYAAIWQAADKIVFSTTLAGSTTAKTRLERRFDPEMVARLKEASSHDLTVGGPGLAAEALRAGLVDEIHLFSVPVLVGGGKAVFPPDVRFALEQVEARSFGNGTVYLRYAVRRG